MKGFTLIELLIVAGVLGALVSVSVVVLNPIKQLDKARDIERIQNIKQVKDALNLYYNDKNCYPASISFGGTFVDPINPSNIYMSKVPQDPDTSNQYVYKADTSSCPQWAIVFAKLAIDSPDTACALSKMSCTPGYNRTGPVGCAISGQVNCAGIGAVDF